MRQVLLDFARPIVAVALTFFAVAFIGNSVVRGCMVPKTRSHFVQTNFHQSFTASAARDGRFASASAMPDRAGQDSSPDLFRRRLAATHQEGGISGGAVVTTVIAVPVALVAIAVSGWIRRGRQFRLGLTVLAATLVVAVVLTAAILRMHPATSQDWMEFSIGPASGTSAFIGTHMIRSSGITLKSAVATAYDVPAVRVIGPQWLAETRYAINAVVGLEDADSFRVLLQQELQNRLHLETHLAVRPFDVFVLTATDAPHLERAEGRNLSIWINEQTVKIQEASMDKLAAALQGILGKPVIDETGITGSYNLEFGWQGDRVAAVTAVLRDRFGLRLTPGHRDLEALIVDNVRRDPSLFLLEQIGRVTRGAPPFVRQRIADIVRVY
ncbi:MAG TPA: TIGR03435 family protein [Vicinamibacterales bacterium]|nr:TIGR03435 family protein [Vicinamibacterales bacterium]